MKRVSFVPFSLPLLLLLSPLAACSRGAPIQTGPLPQRTVHEVGSAAISAPKVTRVADGRAARDGSTVLLAELDGRLVAYVADEDDAMIRVVDVEGEREISRVRPGGIPAQLVMLPDGRLVASLRDASQVVVLGGGGSEGSKLVVDRRVDVPTEPIGLALSPDDSKLVITSGWGHAVSVLETKSMTRIAQHAVAREPRGVVVSSDGKNAFVSHAVGGAVDMVPLGVVGPAKTIAVNGVEDAFERGSRLELARFGCQGFAIARSETGRVFAPQVLVFNGEPNETSSGYGGGSFGREAEVFQVPVIDEDAGKVVGESMRIHDQIESRAVACALPRAASFGKAGLFVTCLGANSVVLYDSNAVNPHEVELRRWSVASGPTGLALDEEHQRAVVWSQFAHALTTIAVGDADDGPKTFALSSLTIPRDARPSAKIERGRELFHSTKERRISSDGRACASCHPDGRDDTLVWSSPKGPRQTPMLAGRLDGAAPYGWNGDAADVSTHLVATFKRLGGSGLTGDDKDALMAYVSSLRPPPKTVVTNEVAVAHGAAIFRSAETGCSTCHGETGDLPDGAKHDVKSRAEGDVQATFDTPSLRFVSGSAPYFHDGRYKDLSTLLLKSDGKMGHTKQLSRADLADLRAYLESI